MKNNCDHPPEMSKIGSFTLYCTLDLGMETCQADRSERSFVEYRGKKGDRGKGTVVIWHRVDKGLLMHLGSELLSEMRSLLKMGVSYSGPPDAPLASREFKLDKVVAENFEAVRERLRAFESMVTRFDELKERWKGLGEAYAACQDPPLIPENWVIELAKGWD